VGKFVVTGKVCTLANTARSFVGRLQRFSEMLITAGFVLITKGDA
jgi:hypothetical protein